MEAVYLGRHDLAAGVHKALGDAGYQLKRAFYWDGSHALIPDNPFHVPADLVVCAHWPRILGPEWLQRDALNLHPNLSHGYKVEDPVGRALTDGHTLMSVACHHMTNAPDSGEIVAEHWRTIPAGSSREYAYQLLLPLYESVLREALCS